MQSLLNPKNLRRALGVLFLLAGGATGVGCETSDTVATNDPLATEAGFCTQLGQAECSPALVQACYDVSKATSSATDSCVTAVARASSCNPQALPYHSENAQEALDTIQGVYAKGYLVKTDLDTLETAFNSVFYRGLPEKSSCMLDSDCDAGSGAVCIYHDEKGHCGVPVAAAPGDSCAAADAQCDTDHYCTSAGSGLACIARPTAGQKCASTLDCAQGLKCGDTGRCISLKTAGASCAVGTECLGGFCVKAEGASQGRCGNRDSFESVSQSCDPFIPQQ